MAFILEEISDEDRKKNSLYKPPYPSTLQKWVIDRERNIFLLFAAGAKTDDDNIRFFELNWDGQKIVITATDRWYKTEKKIDDHKFIYDISYYIEKIESPESLSVGDEDIKLAIEQALKEFGVAGSNQTGNVKVSLPEHIDHYQDKHALSYRGL